ncbi:MAG: hypothetical protein JSS14_05955 [Proteobacteria bacterium]|nr:hypothetical protein [Pseudomonadota bacterium]
MSKQQIALLGGERDNRLALVHALALRLQDSPFCAQAIEDGAQLQSPALVLLLASSADEDAQGLRWREWLAQAGIAFSVLHGDAQARLDAAWRLVEPLLGLAPSPDSRAGSTARWRWSCDKCSDSECEHNLFKDLLQKRAKRGAADEPT